MTLVEVIVAIGLFAMMSTAALGILGSALKATQDDKSRIEAVNLASRELEITRDVFSSATRGPDRITENAVVNQNPLPGGTAGQPLVVDGIPYTVTRTARWEAIGTENAALSPCDQGSSSELAVLHVEVAVWWPALGDRPPLTMDTVMTPAKGTYSTLDGHIGVQVIDSEGNPRSGVTVTATKVGGAETGVTATDGCVLLAHVEAGTWTLTAQTPGFVNRSGDPTATTTAHVQAGQLWRGSIEYDEAATIVATVVAPTDHSMPADVAALPLTLANSSLQPIGLRAVPGSGTDRTIANLWPHPSGYGLGLGGCEDSAPVSGAAAPLSTPRGATTPATLTLAAVEIRGTPGTTVTATHAADRLCTSGRTLRLGTLQEETALPADDESETPGPSPEPTTEPTPETAPETAPETMGVLRVALPYGAWTIGGRLVLVAPGEPTVVSL